jgi:predicted amidophosphoribosyltransferase
MSIVDLVTAGGCAGCGNRGARLCAPCRRALSSPDPPTPSGVDLALSALRYEGAARDLLLALKLRGDRPAAGPLIAALVSLAQRRGIRARVVTFVPGRPRDRRVRGFDHAEVLARGVARGLGLPCCALIARVAEPPDQASLDAAQRRSNLLGAFSPRRAWGEGALLVDDLLTTGATASACAGALRAGGASFVEAMTACHSLRGLKGSEPVTSV